MSTRPSNNHFNSDWKLYNKYGYYPFDRLDNEAVSRTLESGFDDYCVALLAEKLGKMDVAKESTKCAAYYKNLFDPETKLMRGKDTKGAFRTPFSPLKPTSPMNNPGDYTEANAWQYSWASTQHYVAGMIALLGSNNAFTAHLNTFFSITGEGDNKHLGQEGLIGQYAHGNEPNHHIAYLYAHSSEPQCGQELIRQIHTQFYNNTPRGITGNDDCGQMSAWYIFSTLGFYPINPANATFVVGAPQVKAARVRLQNGAVLRIEAENFSPENKHVQSVTLNGKTVQNSHLTFEEVSRGGVLKFVMMK
jgi:predicted alpha-1,2-mannosidase